MSVTDISTPTESDAPPVQGTARSKTSYDEWHKAFAVDANIDTPWHDLLLRHLDPADLDGKDVLEIACGRGGFACWLARRNPGPASLVAADFSWTAVNKGARFAQAEGLNSVQWLVTDAQRLPHSDCTFDTLISCETIEHLPEPRRALTEFARVLRPGGRLYLTTPNYLGPMGAYRGYLRLCGRPYTEEGQPINRFLLLPRTRAWVRAAGLEVMAAESVGHYGPWPGRPPVRYDQLEAIRFLKWFGLHSLVAARKPAASVPTR